MPTEPLTCVRCGAEIPRLPCPVCGEGAAAGDIMMGYFIALLFVAAIGVGIWRMFG